MGRIARSVGEEWIRLGRSKLDKSRYGLRLFVEPVIAALNLKLSRLPLPRDDESRAIGIGPFLGDLSPPARRPYVFVKQIALVTRGAGERIGEIELGSDLHHVETELGWILGIPIRDLNIQPCVFPILK